MTKVKVFIYVVQRSQSKRSLGQNFWHECQCLMTWNVHMKCLLLMVEKVWQRLKLWQRLKFLQMYVKRDGEGHIVIDLGVNLKGIHAEHEVIISYGQKL